MEFKHYNRLAVLKAKSNLTSDEMAKIASLDVNDYIAYESGDKLIDSSSLTKYCIYFNVDPDYMFLEDALK